MFARTLPSLRVFTLVVVDGHENGLDDCKSDSIWYRQPSLAQKKIGESSTAATWMALPNTNLNSNIMILFGNR